MKSENDAIKSLATLAVRGIGQAVDVISGNRGCFFTFHRAASPQLWETLPNRNFYLDLSFLDRLLTYLKARQWDVVTIAQAMARDEQGGAGRYVNFSIDDCYRDTYEEVVPLFRRHNMPVTLFVTTGIPDATMPLWGAGLEDYILNHATIAIEGRVLETDTPEKKRAAYAEIERLWDGSAAGEHYSRFCHASGIDQAAMHVRHAISWDMLAELARDPLVEIGSHTVSHPRISSLDAQQAMVELADSKSRLETKLGITAQYFAFPYGRAADCSVRDFEIARAAGYAGVATTRKGLLGKGRHPYNFPRNTLNGAHRSVLHTELHLSGVTGLVARLAGRV